MPQERSKEQGYLLECKGREARERFGQGQTHKERTRVALRRTTEKNTFKKRECLVASTSQRNHIGKTVFSFQFSDYA